MAILSGCEFCARWIASMMRTTAPNTIRRLPLKPDAPVRGAASGLSLAPDFGRKWQFAVAVNTLSLGRRLALGWTRIGRLPGGEAGNVGSRDTFGFSWRVVVSLREPPLGPIGFPLISLDSLVRIETFQRVARNKARTIFSWRFFRRLSGAGTARTVLAWGSTAVFMGLAYPRFGFSARNCRSTRSLRAAATRSVQRGVDKTR
jgi:hypothetical protein